MLALTENAVTAIRTITDQQDVPAGAGLRIGADQEAGALTLSLAPAPQAGDEVLDASGARLFLDSDAASILDDKALDAAVDTEGGVQFSFSEQPL
jgi:Fe-S cluster assembly iron-binding protein IscA